MNIEITRTLDGSDTLYLADIDEHYHSTFGAIQESMHVFIRSGFDFCLKPEIRILEIGLGTGLNCFLTWIAGRDSGKVVQYFAVEKCPLPAAILKNLNYGERFTPAEADIFSGIHNCAWNCNVQIDNGFVLHKIEADLMEMKFHELPKFDLIYFDAVTVKGRTNTTGTGNVVTLAAETKSTLQLKSLSLTSDNTENILPGNNKILLYPNPVINTLNIASVEKVKVVRIYTLTGSLVLSKLDNQDVLSLDLSGIASGIYIVEVVTANGSTVNKIVKQ